MPKTTHELPWSDFNKKKYKQLYDKLLTMNNDIRKEDQFLKYNKQIINIHQTFRTIKQQQ